MPLMLTRGSVLVNDASLVEACKDLQCLQRLHTRLEDINTILPYIVD